MGQTHSGYDLVLLAGGRSRRMAGVDKVTLPLAGRSSLDRLLDVATATARVVGVGPERQTERPVFWCREDPPGGGPLAAVAAALPHTRADIVVVVAGDMPRVGEALERLTVALATCPDAEVAVLCDLEGVRQPLAAAYRRDALVGRLRRIGPTAGRPVRLLLDQVSVVEVPGGAATEDCDTWADARRITEELHHA